MQTGCWTTERGYVTPMTPIGVLVDQNETPYLYRLGVYGIIAVHRLLRMARLTWEQNPIYEAWLRRSACSSFIPYHLKYILPEIDINKWLISMHCVSSPIWHDHNTYSGTWCFVQRILKLKWVVIDIQFFDSRSAIGWLLLNTIWNNMRRDLWVWDFRYARTIQFSSLRPSYELSDTALVHRLQKLKDAHEGASL